MHLVGHARSLANAPAQHPIPLRRGPDDTVPDLLRAKSAILSNFAAFDGEDADNPSD
jgi:hypothetical protein